MTTNSSSLNLPDQALVNLCLRGEPDAFEQLVVRHQSLVCSLAYAIVGNLPRSEDVAQQAFVTAWKRLGSLQDRSKFKAWLCSITRHLALGAVRREHPAAPLDAVREQPAAEPTPAEAAVSQEEQALVWRALENLPPNYREPLILFYREEHSVARVAVALELSEDAVKQRLSRGREMLRAEMTSLVENALRRSAPGATFTLAVLMALPGVVTTSAAATLGATMAKGSAASNGMGTMGILSAIAGPIMGIMGAKMGIQAALDNAQSEPERQFIRRSARTGITLAVAFCLTLGGLITASVLGWGESSLWQGILFATVTITYVIAILLLGRFHNRQVCRMRTQAAAQPGTSASVSGAQGMREPFEYRSRLGWLGWPLLHVKTGQGLDGRMSRAKGWIAVGDIAYGAVAFGGFAVGGLSLGGVAVGPLALGGVSIGAVAFAGLAIGWWALGGLALGWLAFGGCAIAWSGAMGGWAMAHHFALAGAAAAQHANDAAAKGFMESRAFFGWAEWFTRNMIWLVWLPMVLVLWQAMLAKKPVTALNRASHP